MRVNECAKSYEQIFLDYLIGSAVAECWVNLLTRNPRKGSSRFQLSPAERKPTQRQERKHAEKYLGESGGHP